MDTDTDGFIEDGEGGANHTVSIVNTTDLKIEIGDHTGGAGTGDVLILTGWGEDGVPVDMFLTYNVE
jgi:hypothetical protein